MRQSHLSLCGSLPSAGHFNKWDENLYKRAGCGIQLHDGVTDFFLKKKVKNMIDVAQYML